MGSHDLEYHHRRRLRNFFSRVFFCKISLSKLKTEYDISRGDSSYDVWPSDLGKLVSRLGGRPGGRLYGRLDGRLSSRLCSRLGSRLGGRLGVGLGGRVGSRLGIRLGCGLWCSLEGVL